MKIAYIIPSLGTTGIIKVPLLLSKNLSPYNKIKVFYFEEVAQNVPQFEVSTKKIWFLKFDEELNEYDIVHSHGLKSDFYVWINLKKLTTPKITTIHGFYYDDLKYLYGFKGSILGYFWASILKKFDIAVCVTKTLEEYFQTKFNLDNTHVIYNGISEVSIKKNDINLKLDDASVVKISTVAFLDKRKGTDQLIKLLCLNDHYYLTAVGGGDEKENLQKLANKIGVSERCSLIDFIENPWPTVLDSDVFIFPSRIEGFGLALVEAASLEIPIICSDIPTFREMFEEDEVTFFKVDDIYDLNEKVMALDINKNKQKKAKAKVDKLFRITETCKKYYELYLSLVKKN